MAQAIILAGLAGILGTGLGGLLGITLGHIGKRMVAALLAIAGGIMLAVVFFDLIPHAVGEGGIGLSAFAIFAGIAVTWLLNQAVDAWSRKRGIADTHETVHLPDAIIQDDQPASMFRAGLVMMVAIGLHNLPEGMAIGTGALHTGGVGLALAAIIAIHNIPEGMSIAVPFVEGGMRPGKALFYTALSGAPTLLGGIIGALIGNIGPQAITISLGLAAGAMLYVTMIELLPRAYQLDESNQPRIVALLGVLLGMLLVHWVGCF